MLLTQGTSRCGKKRHTTALVVGLTVGIGGATLIALIALFVCRRPAQRWARSAFGRKNEEYVT